MIEYAPSKQGRPAEWSRHPLPRRGALVIGGDYRGLGIVRSLGRRRIPVWVLADDHLIAATSRYASRRLSWPGTDEASQLDYLLQLGERCRLDGWLLFPTGDETAGLIARHHHLLSAQYRLTTPPWSVLRWAYDKRLTHQLAQQVGVDYPWTFYPRDAADLSGLDCAFPAILKPAVKEGFNPFVHAKAWLVENRAELLARYAEACTMVAPEFVMVQELIPGGGEAQFSFAALCLEGHPIASVTARRARQYPADFGRSSSYVETTEHPKVEEQARRVLAALQLTGLAEVEFKLDPRTGSLKLLDINPRVWGWHSVGYRAGVDFPYLLWRMALGETVDEIRARPGVRWVRMVTDLPAAFQEFRLGRLSPWAYLRSLRGPMEFAIFALDDPLPALAEVPLLSYLSLKRGAA